MQELKKIDISVESRIVANIVSSTELLEQCCNIIDPSLFESPTTQIVVDWAVDYYKRQGEAPGKNLKDVYIARSSELNDSDAQLVYSYMKRGDWSPNTNTEFAKKQLTEYLQGRSMNRLVERLKVCSEGGRIKDCEKAIAEWQKPDVRHTSAVDLFNNVSKIREAVSREDEDALFRFDGDLGKTVGNFVASDYTLFLAPAKRGKTWWLMHTALKAALSGNKVLYISLEMSELDTVDRFARMLSGKSKDGNKTTLMKFRQATETQFELVECEWTPPVINSSANSIRRMLKTARGCSQGGDLRILTYPTNSYSVEDLRRDLITLETFENYVPTVVVIDYVDIMKFQYGNEKRFGLDKLHLELRGLNMERKFSLVSASQAGRQNVTGENDVTEADIAECAAKLNHATKIVLINQTKDEKKQGVYRINVNMARNGGVSYETCVVTSCLDIGRPVMDCHFLKDIYNPKQEKDGATELNVGGFGRRKRGYDE